MLSPDSKIPPAEAQEFWKSVTEKNNFCVVTGDGSSLGSLEDKTRRIWAIARVLEETGGEKSPHKSELEEEAEQAELDFNATVVSLFNRVYYPSRNGLTAAKLSMTFGRQPVPGRGTDRKSAWRMWAYSKLYRTVEDQAEVLMGRRKRCSGPQVATGEFLARCREPGDHQRALAMASSEGLECSRKIAEGRGRWRYSEEGYVEKGPFPKAKTRVLVSERDYKEDTGTATLEILRATPANMAGCITGTTPK